MLMIKIGFDAKRAFCNTRGLGNYSRNLIEGLLNFDEKKKKFVFFARQLIYSDRQTPLKKGKD